jgi:hypothetical protein
MHPDNVLGQKIFQIFFGTTIEKINKTHVVPGTKYRVFRKTNFNFQIWSKITL